MANISKLGVRKKKQLVKLIQLGHTITHAAEECGVTHQTVLNHRYKDPEFDKAVKEARETQVKIVEDALYTTALEGNVTAQIFFLKNRTKYKKGEDRWEDVKAVTQRFDNPLHVKSETEVKLDERVNNDPKFRELTIELLEKLHLGEVISGAVCDNSESGEVEV